MRGDYGDLVCLREREVGIDEEEDVGEGVRERQCGLQSIPGERVGVEDHHEERGEDFGCGGGLARLRKAGYCSLRCCVFCLPSVGWE